MQKLAFTIGALLLMATPAFAGEVHIISRDDFGDFVESQQIYSAKKRGMVKVTYCSKTYFAFPHTVAWTEYETENGRTVGVEYGDGKVWRLICEDPQEQVAYADVNHGLLDKPLWKGAVWFATRR